MAGRSQNPGTELGNRLYNERRKRALTQIQAGARFNVQQATYSRWETGARPPDDSQFAEIARFIGATTDEVWQMVYKGQTPLSLDMVREEIAGLQREMEDLRELRDHKAAVLELRKAMKYLLKRVENLEGTTGTAPVPDQTEEAAEAKPPSSSRRRGKPSSA